MTKPSATPSTYPTDHIDAPPPRAVLVAVQKQTTSDRALSRSLDELEQLVTGLGMEVFARVVQKREAPASASYLGEGKVKEVAALTGGSGELLRGPDAVMSEIEVADDIFVIADDELSAAQTRNLELALEAKVLDRTRVILKVFEARASTKIARLEIEKATIEYNLPRVRDEQSLNDRQGGGGRGSRGDTNVELAKQRLREHRAELARQIDAELTIESQRRKARGETFSVALVGYTNAGKSSLMKLMTGSDVFIEDKLFATLGTTVRPLTPEATPGVLFVDTVGFIDRLPHGLVASFEATLAEATEAWLLLHVVDASDHEFQAQFEVTERVLGEIGAGDLPSCLIFNKADKISGTRRAELEAQFPDALFVSALNPADHEVVRAYVEDFFDQHMVTESFTLSHEQYGIIAAARNQIRVLEEDYADKINVTIEATEASIGRIRSQLGIRVPEDWE